MSFDNLSLEVQNVLLANHSYMTKWFVFLSIILLSSFYVWSVWPNHKQTKFFTTAIMRLFLFGISVSYLASSPLMILLMSPDYSFNSFYGVPLILYSIVMSIIFVLFFIDLFRYGAFVLLRLAGLDLNDSNVNEIARQIENNKHFIKLGFNGLGGKKK